MVKLVSAILNISKYFLKGLNNNPNPFKVMCHKTIYHTLPSGENIKFTIRNRTIDGELFYYANIINIDLSTYQKLNNEEKKLFYGMEITNGRQKSINYRDADKLISDILAKYGHEWLETEK